MQLLMPGPRASKDATRLANLVSNAIDNSRLPVPQPGMGYVGMTEAAPPGGGRLLWLFHVL